MKYGTRAAAMKKEADYHEACRDIAAEDGAAAVIHILGG